MEQSSKVKPARQPNKRRPQKQRKYKYAVSVGALFVIFAVVGALAIVFASISLTRNALDNTREKEMFAKKIQPVVMFDPVPFESAATLDNSSLLFYSMWTILSAENAIDYPKTDSRDIIIPASDLDAAAFSLFGDIVKLEHASFGDDFNRYIYDNGQYLIPPASELYVYTAQVEEIIKDGEYYNLIVGYIPPPDAWTAIYAGGSANEVDKTMIFVMKPVGNDWNLIMVVDDPNSPSLLRLNREGEIDPDLQNHSALDAPDPSATSTVPSEADADVPDVSPEIIIKTSDSAEEDASASDDDSIDSESDSDTTTSSDASSGGS